MLDVSVLRDGKQIYANMGLNDAVIREGPISHVIHLKISSDGKHLVDIAGDGAIIATPTGSTAYSLSAAFLPMCSRRSILLRWSWSATAASRSICL